MSLLLNLLLVLFVVVAVLMVFVILMQRPKSEGLGAAFGGGVTENLFGAQTTNVLTKATGWLAGLFFLLTFVLSVLYARQSNTGSGLRKQLEQAAPPSEAAMPAAIPGAPPLTAPTDPSAPAVGAPGSVTNPAPGGDQGFNLSPPNALTPADQAVGASAPSQPVEAPAPAPAQPQPQPSQGR
jgi:preprotein translocase subunit SecG